MFCYEDPVWRNATPHAASFTALLMFAPLPSSTGRYFRCIWSGYTYPLGGGDSQAIFFCVEAADLADLCNEVDVLFILRLLTLAPLILPVEVEETAGEDEETTGVR